MKSVHCRYARRAFSAVRDDAGVPHIEAASWRECLYGLGYLHALDRPTQMLFAAAMARGQAAERIHDTPELLETDRFFRRVGLYLGLEREVRELDDAVFDQLTAYCQGVNDGLGHGGRSLPMWATGFQPTAWTQESVLLIGRLLAYGGLVVSQLQNERILVDMVQVGVADEKMRELFRPLLDNADFDLLRQLRVSSQLSDEALELITDLPRLAGSNAWAVSPARSATGSALLAADPHLEVHQLPAVWHEAVLSWGDGEYVMGATLPGCPLFAIARTPRLAWGVTYLKSDTADYFIEDCRPGGATGWQYRRGDDWFDFDRRVETIYRKGNNPESAPILSNEVGVMDSDPQPGVAGYYLSTAWVGGAGGAGRSIATWLDVIAAPDAAAAMDIVRECPTPSLVWVFADRAGHIGRQACGWIPRRPPGISGLLPIPAWDVRNHWRGRLPSDVLPRSYDPPEGFVASANENINSPGGPQLVTLVVPDYRCRRIRRLLAALPKATVADMQRLQYDVISAQAQDLLPIFLEALQPGELRDRLAKWDGGYWPTSRDATLFANLYRNVLLEIFGHEHGIGWRRMIYMITRIGFSTMVLTSIDRLLAQRESIWWQGRYKQELIRRAATRLKGEPDVPWSVTNGFSFTSRFVDSRFVGRALGYATREMAMPGNHATVFQGHLLKSARRTTSFAPSYHFVTDLGADEAWTNLPGGASESPLSGLYKTEIGNWRSGVYKRLTVSADGGTSSR